MAAGVRLMVASASFVRVSLGGIWTLAVPGRFPVYGRTQVLVGLVILALVVVAVVIGVLRRGR